MMDRAITVAQQARTVSSPNPWVGCVIVAVNGTVYEGATEQVGGRHAEIVALDAAGEAALGATVYVTLEPCSHQGRTPSCADALINAGVGRVVFGIEDPDPHVAGRGIARLIAAGVDVEQVVDPSPIEAQLTPYLKHRRTGRPYVVCKLAASLDGRTAAPDGTSQWITGIEARTDAHRLRAESDAILVGAGTVRDDDPSLTVRHVSGRDPRRIVLGSIPPGAAVLPAEEYHGDVDDLLDRLGNEGVVQLLIEGGATVAHEFHGVGLVDRYVLYLAPLLLGGDDARGMFAGPGAATLAEAWRGSVDQVLRLGSDLRVDLVPG